MIDGARYGHTDLVARDWRSLARFYVETFGCVMLSPERDYSGPDLEAGTGVPGARLRGAHLRLPGHGDHGPTLEIFQYEPEGSSEPAPPANRPGYGHIAFRGAFGSGREARGDRAWGISPRGDRHARALDRSEGDVVLRAGSGRESDRASVLVVKPRA